MIWLDSIPFSSLTILTKFDDFMNRWRDKQLLKEQRKEESRSQTTEINSSNVTSLTKGEDNPLNDKHPINQSTRSSTIRLLFQERREEEERAEKFILKTIFQNENLAHLSDPSSHQINAVEGLMGLYDLDVDDFERDLEEEENQQLFSSSSTSTKPSLTHFMTLLAEVTSIILIVLRG